MEINTQKSTTIDNLNVGVFQGSVMSSLLYLIYSMDITSITHEKKHSDNYKENNCNSPKIESYVDDTYGIITENKWNIWQNINKYINKINNYY